MAPKRPRGDDGNEAEVEPVARRLRSAGKSSTGEPTAKAGHKTNSKRKPGQKAVTKSTAVEATSKSSGRPRSDQATPGDDHTPTWVQGLRDTMTTILGRFDTLTSSIGTIEDRLVALEDQTQQIAAAPHKDPKQDVDTGTDQSGNAGSEASDSSKFRRKIKDIHLPYPRKPVQDMLNRKGSCKAHQSLLRHWILSRARDTRVWCWARHYNMLVDEMCFSAIASVTEAISLNGEEMFALASPLLVMSARRKHPVPDLGKVARPGKRLLLPWTDSLAEDQEYIPGVTDPDVLGALYATGHTFLIEISISKDVPGTVEMKFHDSDHRQLDNDDREELEAKLRKVLDLIGWKPTDMEIQNFNLVSPIAQQRNENGGVGLGETCGIHTVLNAWALAMRLPLNSDFVADMPFYTDALLVINLAMSGHLDWAAICAFLLCSKYVANFSLSSREVPMFERTFGFRDSDNSLNNHRLRMLVENDSAAAEPTAESQPSSNSLDDEAEHVRPERLRERLGNAGVNLSWLPNSYIEQVYEVVFGKDYPK